MPFIYGIIAKEQMAFEVDEDLIVCNLDRNELEYIGTLPKMPSKPFSQLKKSLEKYS